MKRSRRMQKIVFSMEHWHSSSWDLWDFGEWLFLQGISLEKWPLLQENSSLWPFSLQVRLRYFFSSGEDIIILLRLEMRSGRRNEKELSSIPSSPLSFSSHPIAFSRILLASHSRLWKSIFSSLYWSVSHQEWRWILSLLQMIHQNQWRSSWQKKSLEGIASVFLRKNEIIAVPMKYHAEIPQLVNILVPSNQDSLVLRLLSPLSSDMWSISSCS